MNMGIRQKGHGCLLSRAANTRCSAGDTSIIPSSSDDIKIGRLSLVLIHVYILLKNPV
jgi:hypothetical protein